MRGDPNVFDPDWEEGTPPGIKGVRVGDRELEPGAIVAFPRGPDGAHRVAAGDEAVRVLLISTMNFPDIAEHLSTGTTLTMTRPGTGRVFAADGERPLRT